MALDNWGTPLRDVLTEADVRLEVGELNEKLLAFLSAEGEAYRRPYAEISKHFGQQITENRIETWKKLFQELGLLWIEDGAVALTRFGRTVLGAHDAARQMADDQQRRIAESAVRVLGRQQLLNPTTLNRDYPTDCDVLPYRVIWSAIQRLGSLHWEELHRVLLRVMRQEQAAAAIERIETARKSADYDPQVRSSAEKHLGPAVYEDEDQVTRRMTPWFSAAGFGGLLIDREPSGGYRKFTPLGADLIGDELSAQRTWRDFGDDQKAWFEFLDGALSTGSSSANTQRLKSALPNNDPVWEQVLSLLDQDAASGIMFIGPPGTGKSWYARQIAIKLTEGDPRRIRDVQFHASYQYSDFVEGYVPDGDRGFRLVDRHLLEMIDLASQTEGRAVLVIDELSRADPSRVLGEALTYMESSLRGVSFYLPSGRQVSIPPNLVFLATMNPEDRSVDELDAALERRWAKVELRPDKDKLREFLIANGASGSVIGATVDLFVGMQKHMDLGHALFRTVKTQESLQRLWNTQLSHMIKKRFRFDAGSKAEIDGLWARCLDKASNAGTAEAPTVPTIETPNA